MGEVAARTVLGVSKPKIGLLNVGTEEVKGDDVVRKAAAMLRECDLPVDFAGFVEGTDVTEGSVDVVVTDGFTGNVALKMAEGTVALISAGLREAFQSSLGSKVAYIFARNALKRLRQKFDPRLYNGAMFLGVNGVVVKSHGGTDALGFSTAVRVAADLVRKGANDRIIDEMRAVSAALEPAPQAAAS
jgi:glycerol-3-phosphate acyltransferase PlsX